MKNIYLYCQMLLPSYSNEREVQMMRPAISFDPCQKFNFPFSPLSQSLTHTQSSLLTLATNVQSSSLKWVSFFREVSTVTFDLRRRYRKV